MYHPEIEKVKQELEYLKQQGLISRWELPFENILTRLAAAIFFIEAEDDSLADIKARLQLINDFSLDFSDGKLSELRFKLTFTK